MRLSGRCAQEVRPITIVRHFTQNPEGSVLISLGKTYILCTASVEESVPRFIKGRKQGWITAEYSMLPRATHFRNPREVIKGRQDARTLEIQRFISRSLRAAVDLSKLGEYTIILDCDVLQADGGTRTASVTGAFVALVDALIGMKKQKKIKSNPIKGFIAAISVGIVNGEAVCDLEYAEDAVAETDMNIVMMEDGQILDIQGTAEKKSFSYEDLTLLIKLAYSSILGLIRAQKSALSESNTSFLNEFL